MKNNVKKIGPIIFFTLIIAFLIPLVNTPIGRTEETTGETPRYSTDIIPDASPDASPDANIDLLSRYDDIGPGYSFVIENDLLFLASGDVGLIVYNVSDPAHVTKIGGFYSGGVVTDVQLFDSSIAYLLNPDIGIEIVDISDPSDITLLKTFTQFTRDNLDWALNILIEDNLCFFSYSEFGLLILDITDPLLPVNIYDNNSGVGGWGYEDYKEKIVFDDFLFSSDGYGELSVFDISNPATPEKIANYSCVNFMDFSIYNDSIYISHEHILEVFNFSAESGFEQTHYFDLGFNVDFFEISHLDNLLVYSFDTFYVFDLNYTTDAYNLVNQITVGSPAGDYRFELQIVNNISYLLDYHGRLNIFNNTQILSEDIFSKVDFRESASFSVLFDEDTLITAMKEGGIQILDISDKNSPLLISQFSDNSIVYDIQFYGSTLLAATSIGLKIFNIGENKELSLLNSTFETFSYSKVSVDYPVLYLTSQFTLFTYNITNITSPMFMDSFLFDTTFYLKHLELNEDFAAISSYKQFWLIDTTNPLNLTVLSQVTDFKPSYDSIQNLHIYGNVLYASDYNYIYMFDIVNRSQPLFVKTIYLGFQNLEGDFIFQNDLLFTTDMRTIYIINMSIGIPRIERTSQPYVSDAGFSSSGHCQLILSGNILILTDQILGVLIFDLTIPPEEDDATDTGSENPDPDDPSFFDIPGFGILELLGVVIVSVALLTLKNKRINHNLEG